MSGSHESDHIAAPFASDFNEDHWPCVVVHQDSYAMSNNHGRMKMGRTRAVLCGLARDLGTSIHRTIFCIERLGAMFADYRVVVFENDSQDETLPHLRSWHVANSRVTILSETLGHPRWPPVRDHERMRQLAYYRNRYRAHVVDHFGDFDYVIVLDTDLAGWSTDGVVNTIGHSGWDVVAANGLSPWRGRHIFYDCWAFRALGHPEPHTDLVPLKAMVFPRGTPLVPVLSCFNGLAVYRMAAMHAADYDGSDCEHAALHLKMRLSGFTNIFLNPSMITLYPDADVLNPLSTRKPWWE
jgi:hypothetical protein